MGRNNTGVWTTRESKRINLSYLLKTGYVKQGCLITGTLSWTDGSAISVRSDLTTQNKYIRLSYTTTSRTGEKKDFNYQVRIVSVPSNLGKGEVLYFICPSSGKRCRILYKAYGNDIWKSREAYSYRIYYPLQLSSKKNIYNDRYWQLEEELIKEHKRRKTSTYMGKPTKRALRNESLENAQTVADNLRWSWAALPVRVRKLLNGHNINEMRL